MKLNALKKNRPAKAFLGIPTNPTTLIIQLIIFLVRLILGGIPAIPII